MKGFNTLVIAGILVCGAAEGALSKAEQTKRGLKPFKAKVPLEIKGNSSARLEDLVVNTSRNISARVDIKNLTTKEIYYTISLILYDKEGDVIACGNSENIFPTSLRSRESKTIRIKLGWVLNLVDVKYYKAWVVTIPKKSR